MSNSLNPKKTKDFKDNKMRKEFYDDMNKKDLEIKTLKEMVMRYKITAMDSMSDMRRVETLGMVREEMKMVDCFLKSVLKDSIVNYEMIEKVAAEKRSKKKDPKIESLIKKFHQTHLESINFNNCQCSTCNMNKAGMKSIFNRNYSPLSRSIYLTDKVTSLIHYDKSRLMIEVHKEEDKVKEVRLKSIFRKDEEAVIKFIWNKTSKEKDMEYKFNMHPELFVTQVVGERPFTFSMSSYLTVKAMREETEQSIAMVNLTQTKNLIHDGNCFMKFIEKILGAQPMKLLANSMSMLHEYEEMELLTEMSDKDVYVRIKDGELDSVYNHISMDKFDGCMIMKAYMLITPMFRKVMFYSDMEDFEKLDFSDASLDKEEQEMTATGTEEKKNLFDISNMGILNKHYGTMLGDFFKNVYKKRNSNKGFHEDLLEELMSSYMADFFIQSHDLDITNLYVLNISFKQFLAISFHVSDFKEMSNLVYNKPITTMKQMMNNVKNMFLDELIKMNKDYKNMDLKELQNKWIDFLNKVEENLFMDKQILKRMFWDFKNRVFSYIYITKWAYDENCNTNSSTNTMKMNHKFMEDTDDYTKMFLNMWTSRLDTKNLITYQPSMWLKSRSDLKDGVWMEMCITESNKILDSFQEMEKEKTNF